MPSVEKGKRPKIKGLLDHLFHSKMGWFLVISSHPPLEREAVYPNPWRFWYWAVSFYFTVIAWTPTRKMTIFNRLFIKKVLWLTMRCPEERCGLRGTFTPELRSCLLLAPDALLLSTGRPNSCLLRPLSVPCFAQQGSMSCLPLPVGSHTDTAWKCLSFRCYLCCKADKPWCSASPPSPRSLPPTLEGKAGSIEKTGKEMLRSASLCGERRLRCELQFRHSLMGWAWNLYFTMC